MKRIGALVFENEKPLFKDGPDMEASESLLLSETICAAVKRMDDSAVTTELIRSHCPVNGTLEEKQRRLQNKLCMSLGEMSMSAANMNTSVNFLRQASPEMDNSATVQLHGDLEMLNDTFTNSQKCIEDTLKLVVDNIVEMKSEISNVKQSSQPAADMQCFTDDQNSAVAAMKLSIQSLSSEVKQCSLRINELVKKLGEVKDHLKQTSEETKAMKNNAVEIMKQSVNDMEGYHNSVFADESRQQIQEIYDLVIRPYDEGEYVPDETHQESCPAPLEEQLVEVSEEVPDHPEVEPPQVSQPQGFTFADKISPNLQHVVKSNQKIDVWLITDSIMRHVNEDDMDFKEKYRVNLHRIDRSTTESLKQAALIKQIASRKPHIIYLHLGINDIQKGRSPTETLKDIEKFDAKLREVSPLTKLILSSPLLNGNSQHQKSIVALRRSFIFYLNKFEQFSDFVQARLTVQQNAHFLLDPNLNTSRQNPRYFQENDRLHLSDRGKSAMIYTMRDTLYAVLKEQEEH